MKILSSVGFCGCVFANQVEVASLCICKSSWGRIDISTTSRNNDGMYPK